MAKLFEFLSGHQTELWAFATVLVGALINRLFRLRARLKYAIGHSFNLIVEQPLLDANGKEIAPTQLVRTASIIIGNTGLLPAKRSEITFNWKPIFNIWPARSYAENVSAFGRYSIVFESVAPNEQINIEIMAINAELPDITSVRCDECVAKMIPMTPQRVWPGWLLTIVGLVMLLGASTALYLLITGLQLIAQPIALPIAGL
jgi:hypothetical protein